MFFRELIYEFERVGDLFGLLVTPACAILGILFCFAGYRLFFNRKRSMFKYLTICGILGLDVVLIYLLAEEFDNLVIAGGIGLAGAILVFLLLKPLIIIITCAIGDALILFPLYLYTRDEELLILAGIIIGMLGLIVQLLTNKKKKKKEEIIEDDDKSLLKKKKRRKSSKSEKVTKIKSKKKRRKRKPLYKRVAAMFSKFKVNINEIKKNHHITDEDHTMYDKRNDDKSKHSKTYNKTSSDDNIDKTSSYNVSNNKDFDSTICYKKQNDIEKTICDKINETQNTFEYIDNNIDKTLHDISQNETVDHKEENHITNHNVEESKSEDLNNTIVDNESETPKDIDHTIIDNESKTPKDIDNTIYEASSNNNEEFENSYEEDYNEEDYYYDDDEYYDDEDEEDYEEDAFDIFEAKFWKLIAYLTPKYIKFKSEFKIKYKYWISKIKQCLKDKIKKAENLMKKFINKGKDNSKTCYKGDTEEIPVIKDEDL